MTTFYTVAPTTYINQLAMLQHLDDGIAAATTTAHEMPVTCVTYYMTADMCSGFGVTTLGELVGVFSTIQGRAHDLIRYAKKVGATHLDCFDGFLPKLYEKHDFYEIERVSNWTPGEPDVVFMQLLGTYS